MRKMNQQEFAGRVTEDSEAAEQLALNAKIKYNRDSAAIDAKQAADTRSACKRELSSHRTTVESPELDPTVNKITDFAADPQCSAPRRSATRGELACFLRQLEVAMSDAKGGGSADWVCILQARDWIRYTCFDYMAEHFSNAAPLPTTWAAKLSELEDEWCDIDEGRKKSSIDPDVLAILSEVELAQAVRLELVIHYMLQIQYRMILGENEMEKINAELAPLFTIDGPENLMSRLKAAADRLGEFAPRIKWVGDQAGDCADRIAALHDVIDQRGIIDNTGKEVKV